MKSRMPSASYALLTPGRDQQGQSLIEQAFFRGLRLANGTYKTTYANRMSELDDYCASLATNLSDCRILDVGLSSGVTSAELLDKVLSRTSSAQLTGVDICLYGRVTRIGPCEVLLDSDGRTLQVAYRNAGRGRPHSPLGSPARFILETFMILAGRAVRLMRIPSREVTLVSRGLATRPDAVLRELSLFVRVPEWIQRFWLVRAANILNIDYFSRDDLGAAIDILIEYVQPGGYLLLNRTIDVSGENHGSLFQLTRDRSIKVVRRFGKGSEIERMVPEASPR
jgi:hypothetical protein